MKKLTKIRPERLREILELHRLWLKGDDKGVRANLSWTNLRGLDLRGIILKYAKLRGTDFRRTNLSETDLTCTRLGSANFYGAILDKTMFSWPSMVFAFFSWHALDNAIFSFDQIEVNK